MLLHVPVDRPLMDGNPRVQIFAPYWRERIVIARDLAQVPKMETLDAFAGKKIAVPGQTLAGWLLIGSDGGKYREQLLTKWKDGVEAAQALQRGEVVAAAGMASELESALAGDARYAIDPLPIPRGRDGWAVGLAVKKDAPTWRRRCRAPSTSWARRASWPRSSPVRRWPGAHLDRCKRWSGLGSGPEWLMLFQAASARVDGMAAPAPARRPRCARLPQRLPGEAGMSSPRGLPPEAGRLRPAVQAQAHQGDMLALLLQSTEEGVWTIDNELRTVDANPAMCRLLGVQRDTLIGRSIYEFVDADNEQVFRDQVRRRDEGVAGSYEISLRRSDGTLVHCQNNPAPLFDRRGRKIGAIGLFTDITALKRTAAELQRTSDLLAAKTSLLQATLESLSQGVINVSADGRIEAWNRRVLDLLQLPAELLQRKPLLRDIVEWQVAQGHLGPTSPPQVGAEWRQAAERQATGDGTLLWGSPLYQRELADGRVLEVQLHRAAGGAQVRTYTDVTDRVLAQRAMAASEARFRAMADAAPALIWQSDTEGRAIWFNQSWLRRLGCDLPQALALGWAQRIHADDVEHCRQVFADAVSAQQPFEVEYRLLATAGVEAADTVWIVDRGIPHVDDQGAFDGYLAYGWDITGRKAAEQALIAARDEAERANDAKSQFLSRMSHELRTPLNAVVGFAQLMERDRVEPPGPLQQERLQHILRGSRHLLVLINDVLDLARIESGALGAQLEPVDIQTLVEGCRRLVEPMARERGVSLLSLQAPPGPAVVNADPTRLRQVVLNLLSNAIKYNRDGGDVVLSCSGGPACCASRSATPARACRRRSSSAVPGLRAPGRRPLWASKARASGWR